MVRAANSSVPQWYGTYKLPNTIIHTIMKISFATSALVIAAAEAFHVGHSGRRTTSLNILAGTER